MADEKKNAAPRSDRLLNDVGNKVWNELVKEYGRRSLKRVASAAIVAFQKLPHEGRIKAFKIADGETDLELMIEVVPDEAEVERLRWRCKQLQNKLDKGISHESAARKRKKAKR